MGSDSAAVAALHYMLRHRLRQFPPPDLHIQFRYRHDCLIGLDGVPVVVNPTLHGFRRPTHVDGVSESNTLRRVNGRSLAVQHAQHI